MERLYLDANIYLDYWGNRSDKMRPLGEFAFQLLRRAIRCEFRIVLSDLVLEELNKFLRETEINLIFRSLESMGKLIHVHGNDLDKESSVEISAKMDVPWQDVLHCVLARRGGADCIVTRDKHFSKLKDLLESYFPEDI